jgi:hypothetical protein
MECRALTFLRSSVRNLPKPASKMRDKKKDIVSRRRRHPGTQHRAQARFMSRLKWGP